MPISVNVNNVWKDIKGVNEKFDGTWKQIEKVFEKIGGEWKEVYIRAIKHAFTASITATTTTGIRLSDYVNPADADYFIFTVNSGVTLRGKTGGVGGNGAGGSSATVRGNCHNSQYGNGGNGGTGGSGGGTLDFTGFENKTVLIINNGTVIGGTGGNGGNGGNLATRCGYTSYSGCGGAGGAGGSWRYNYGTVSVTVEGNAPSNGSNGGAGAHGTPTSMSGGSCNCYNFWCCFPKGQKVLMADGSHKLLEDIKVGDKLQGAYGPDDINEVQFTQVVYRGDRTIFNINGQLVTGEHGFIAGERDSIKYFDFQGFLDEIGTPQVCKDAEGKKIVLDYVGGNENTEEIDVPYSEGDTVYTERGSEKAVITPTDIDDKHLLSLCLQGGSRSCSIGGVFVPANSDNSKFNYKTGKVIDPTGSEWKFLPEGSPSAYDDYEE